MAKTATFGVDNVLINTYTSLKEAKTAHKGEKDIQFVTEKNFGDFADLLDADGNELVITDLFEVKEVKEPSDDKPTRERKVFEGPYHVVKEFGPRFDNDDERGLLHEALVANTTCEAFLESAPEQAKYVSTKGKESTCTSRAWLGYAVKRGWIAMGEDRREEDRREEERRAA